MKQNEGTRPDVQDAIARQAAEWFVAHREGPLTGAQRAAFTAWLRTSPLHVREYLAVAGVAKGLRSLPDADEFDLDALLARASQEDDRVIAFEPRADSVAVTDRTASRTSGSRRWAIAAGLGAVLLTAASVYLHEMLTDRAGDVLATAHGEQRVWRLPDGSVVRLNSGSELRTRFSQTDRLVEVTRGQAMFEVATDPNRPFRVVARRTEVVALGTAFEVYCKEEATVVTVLTGKVAVYRKDDVGGVMVPVAPLTAGEQVRVSHDESSVKVARVDLVRTLAWTQQQIIFEEERLADVAREFNRYGQVPLEVLDDQLRDLCITGIFNAYDTDSFVGFLRRLEGVEVEAGGETIVIRSAPRKDSGT